MPQWGGWLGVLTIQDGFIKVNCSLTFWAEQLVIRCAYINPLTTDDAFWHHQILAACYQLAQSVLEIGSVLAERVGQGEVGGSTALPDSAWWWLQLPVLSMVHIFTSAWS